MTDKIEISLLALLYHYGMLNVLEIKNKINAEFIIIEARIEDMIEKGLIQYFPNSTGRFVYITIAGYKDYLVIRD
jgi:predicted transcriptional regulator